MAIYLCVVQFWSKVIAVISNRTRAYLYSFKKHDSKQYIQMKTFLFFQNIALVGSLQLVTSYKHCTQRKNREAWFNYVKSQNPTGMSLSIENVPPKVDTPVDFHLEVYLSHPMGVQYVSI